MKTETAAISRENRLPELTLRRHKSTERPAGCSRGIMTVTFAESLQAGVETFRAFLCGLTAGRACAT